MLPFLWGRQGEILACQAIRFQSTSETGLSGYEIKGQVTYVPQSLPTVWPDGGASQRGSLSLLSRPEAMALLVLLLMSARFVGRGARCFVGDFFRWGKEGKPRCSDVISPA